MPLQTGSWTINSSGNLGQLNIASVDTSGHVTGSMKIGIPTATIAGFWDEISGKLSFAVFISTSEDPTSKAYLQAGTSYIGFLFQDLFRMPGITGSSVSTLSGYYHAWPHSIPAGSATKPILGWYAQIGSV